MEGKKSKYWFYSDYLDNQDVRIYGLITPKQDCDEKELFHKIEDVFKDVTLNSYSSIEFYTPMFKYSKEYDSEISRLLSVITKDIYIGTISLEYSNNSDMIYCKKFIKLRFSETAWNYIWSAPRKKMKEN